ncbi:MAG: ABC transporter substrate-binding protein [Candidatus Omnitrophota bacterium]
MKNTIRILLVALCVVAAVSRFADGITTQPRKASFLPQWAPQAQFAGYYVAFEKGFYRKYGIDLTIITGGPDKLPSDFLDEGKADFVTMWLATGIEKRAKGDKLINIAQIVQKSALMLVSKKSRGIYSPKDLNGKKVSLWAPIYQIQPRAFFKKYGLEMEIIPQSYSINLFLRDGVDAVSAMWYNEYHTILNAGYNADELTSFFFYEHDLNFPEEGIYVLEKKYDADPALCRAFVAATLEGWRYAFEHPDEAVKIILSYMKRARIPANRVHQEWMLERMKDLILGDGGYADMGILSEGDYYRVARELMDNGMIDNMPKFGPFYRKVVTGDEK